MTMVMRIVGVVVVVVVGEGGGGGRGGGGGGSTSRRDLGAVLTNSHMFRFRQVHGMPSGGGFLFGLTGSVTNAFMTSIVTSMRIVEDELN